MKKQACIPLEDLTEEQVDLRACVAGLMSNWLFPAVLRVEGTPERAFSYMLQALKADLKEFTNNPMPIGYGSTYGHHAHMLALVLAAGKISRLSVEEAYEEAYPLTRPNSQTNQNDH